MHEWSKCSLLHGSHSNPAAGTATNDALSIKIVIYRGIEVGCIFKSIKISFSLRYPMAPTPCGSLKVPTNIRSNKRRSKNKAHRHDQMYNIYWVNTPNHFGDTPNNQTTYDRSGNEPKAKVGQLIKQNQIKIQSLRLLTGKTRIKWETQSVSH